MFFNLHWAELCLSRNLWNRRVGFERDGGDAFVYLGPWLLTLSTSTGRP